MKKVSLLLSLFFVFSLIMSTSCSKDSKEEPQPTAYFNAPSSVDVGQTVYFQNESQNAHRYYWSFGDGSESNETNPTHTYYSSGYKTVSMTAYSESGNKQDNYSRTIYVEPSTGDCMFWTDYSTEYVITVTLNGIDKTITNYYYSTPSSCGASGCATYWDLEEGTYYYYAENYLYWWSGYITVYADDCSKMLLYASKGNLKEKKDSQVGEKLTIGVDE